MGRHSSYEMARLTVRVPRGHQGFWEIIRDLKTFRVSDVDQRSNVHKATVRDFIKRLLKGGYIEAVAEDDDGTVHYRLVKDQAEAPRLRRDGSPAADVGLGQDHMWRAMKMLGSFTARDLAIHASTDDVQVRLNTAASYIKHLHRAGYLAIQQAAKPGHRPGAGTVAVYRLIPTMISGPLAPQVMRSEWVWDPNTKQVRGPEAGGAE